jgi:hypothetical protein
MLFGMFIRGMGFPALTNVFSVSFVLCAVYSSLKAEWVVIVQWQRMMFVSSVCLSVWRGH